MWIPPRTTVLGILILSTLISISLLILPKPRRAVGSVPYLLPSKWRGSKVTTASNSASVLSRIRRLESKCESTDEFEVEYGRTNLRMSRGYEGSQFKLQQFMQKALRGERLVISAIGGSISKGHHVWDTEIWHWMFFQWLHEFVGKDLDVVHHNGAQPAVGSDYFSFCFPLHIPADSDLVLVELGVNDEGIPEHVENMENLLRGLLAMEKGPAVILVEAMAFSTGGMGGGGGRMHLPVAQYYDVPVINQRHPLVSHFARYPELIPPYFATDFWGNPDTRHLNSRGHRDLGMLVGAFIQDVTCDMLADPLFVVPEYHQTSIDSLLPPHSTKPSKDDVTRPETVVDEDLLFQTQESWAQQTKSSFVSPSDDYPEGYLMPGMFNTPAELGILPRQKVLSGWNPDLRDVTPAYHPTCLSTRTSNPGSNDDLIPVDTQGWERWVHPDHKDKPYLIATEPGSWVKFQLSTSVGIVKVYGLKSRTFGLGNIDCWVDDGEKDRVTVEGYWDNDAFATIKEGLSIGRHTLTCRLLRQTSDPGGGTEFRLIGVMSL